MNGSYPRDAVTKRRQDSLAQLLIPFLRRPCRARSRSVYHPHAAPAAQLFYAMDEGPVRQDIIALRRHHHGEVAFALQVEQDTCFAFVLLAEHVKLVNR